MSATEAKILRSSVNSNIEPDIVKLAKESVHQAIFTPPHYSNSQLIELLWARIKVAIDWNYTTNITLQDVIDRLSHQNQILDSDKGKDTFCSIINDVDGVIRK